MKKIFLIAGLLLLGACTPNGIVREEYVKAHPELDTDTKVDIIMGRIRKGMNKDQVKIVMGEPCGYCYGTKSSSWVETWEYNPFGTGSYSIGSGTYIFFDKGGRVTGWSK